MYLEPVETTTNSLCACTHLANKANSDRNVLYTGLEQLEGELMMTECSFLGGVFLEAALRLSYHV